jgi:hypothetical protein
MEESEKLGMRHATSVSLQALQNDKGKLMLESFLSGLKSENAEELIEFFSQNAQSIDIFGKRWNREEMFENFATLFAHTPRKTQRFLSRKQSRMTATYLSPAFSGETQFSPACNAFGCTE